MLVDHRTYRIKPGHTQMHLKIYEQYGYKAQTRHLGQPIAYMFAESGDVNTVVHNWAYEDAADRARRRSAMQADPEWIAFVEESAKLGALEHQENCLMQPVSFFPLKR